MRSASRFLFLAAAPLLVPAAAVAQTPDQAVRRAKTTTSLRNLFLAGDWTDTGLPATIEGAVQSGFKAASQALSAVRNTAADKPQ